MSHSLALFSLVPINDKAIEAVDSPHNKQFVSVNNENRRILDIGHIRSKSGNASTLATLGRNGDIILDGNSISKIQCSFEINTDTNVVMFYDRSHTQTSQIYDVVSCDSKPFEYGRPRKVVVGSRWNRYIGLGGARRNIYEFRLEWKESIQGTMSKVKKRGAFALQENTRLAETVDESDTTLPSQMETRVHYTGPRQLPIRWGKVTCLGSGSFGDVYKAVNVDTGNLIAVKILKKAKAGMNMEYLKKTWWREVKVLSTAKHPNIVEYMSSSGWDGDVVEIFMALKDGSLKSLISSKRKHLMNTKDIIKLVCHHILQAIDYLAVRKIVHRDIKPDNILYSEQAGRYNFLLGDFGLCNHQSVAGTGAVGSGCYIAPELYQPQHRTDKADIWGLFVTLLWTSGNQDFRGLEGISNNTADFYKSIQAIGVHENHLVNMREMGALNPNERASAAQMLVKYYGGEGLSTSPSQVPPLPRPQAILRQAPAHPMPHQPPTGHPAPAMGDEVLPADYQAPPMVFYNSPVAYQSPARVHEDQALIRRDTAIAHDVQTTPHPVAPPQLGPRRATHPHHGAEHAEPPFQ